MDWIRLILLLLLYVRYTQSTTSHGNQGFNCSFEDGFCSWTQREGDGPNWLLGAGSTAVSRVTGPGADRFGNETGMFLYCAVSGDDTPIIDSPVVEVNEEDGVDLCLSFWYSMYGRYIGGLEVYTYTATNATNGTVKVFSARGPQTGRRGWLHGLVDIRDVTSDMRLYFQGLSGVNRAIVAIDDINLQTGVCERDTSFNCNFEEGSLCGWVKPPTGSDDTDWLLQRGATYTPKTGPIVDHTTGSTYVLYTVTMLYIHSGKFT
ncbi:MAM and LDL-receptor class A domain-containing protein 1-like [Patiria miniata]|uniref:MAM domain-containing protein n=1 Tax=Patiria miniata TaxID=46514 RepID=A0A913ZPN5_PATMI|nr:MAM and LDL-receptor class A domain-containing protein 1-like [Patiria miniata]